MAVDLSNMAQQIQDWNDLHGFGWDCFHCMQCGDLRKSLGQVRVIDDFEEPVFKCRICGLSVNKVPF